MRIGLLGTSTPRVWFGVNQDVSGINVFVTCSQSDRKVLWVWDATGNTGKTFLGEWLCVHRNAFLITGGKHADIAYAYNLEPYVVFDLTRDQAERIPYPVIESFKNGYLFSPKYESCTKRFAPARVVVFANYRPDEARLSADRWDIRNIGQPPADAPPAVHVGDVPPAPFFVPSILDIDDE